MVPVENIIHQIAERFIEQIFEKVSETGINSIGKLAQEVLCVAKATGLEIIHAAIKQADDALVTAQKARRVDGLRIKERNVSRTLLTELGTLTYERTYFETTNRERYYLLDHLIGVEGYERLSKELCASLVQEASRKSLQEATRSLGVAVSRQTVDNKVLALKEVVTEAEAQSETPKELHVFADEDHVHMKSGGSAIVPLVTVTEGIDTSQRRHKTINAVHFEGYGIGNSEFFEGISSFLGKKYRMEKVETIYVHADGGRWIQAAEDWLPNVRFVMDGYHLEKRLKKISRLTGAAKYMGAVRRAIEKDDVKRFTALCAKIREGLDQDGCEVIDDNKGFILTHWGAAVLRLSGKVCGSCTEPLVSHVLSERLSRNPLAWSEHGIRQMAMLRVYVKNGGTVSSGDIRISCKKDQLVTDKKTLRGGFAKYKAYADEQIDDFLKTKPDWSFFEKHPFRYGKLDGSSMLLRAWGSCRDPCFSA